MQRQNLSQFVVEHTRFYKREQIYGGPEPITDLKVHNKSKYAISRVYFDAVLRSPGRSVPWLEKSFNYAISGGLEPDESAEWTLAPNRFSEWGQVKYRKDMVLELTPNRLDGPHGEKLYAVDWSSYDEERLASLIEKLGSSAGSE